MMPRSNSRVLSGILAGFAALALSGCITLLPEQERTTLYRLSSHLPAEASAPHDAPVVRVGRPFAPRALSGDRVALDTGEGRIAYMAGASWVSPVPFLVQELIMDTFDRRAEGVTAARPDEGVAARYDLRLELRRFEAVYDEGEGRAPRVDVALRARLIDGANREVAGLRSINVSQRASSNRQSAIVDAFSRAASEAAAELVDWTGERVAVSEAAAEAALAQQQ
ncbi:ABC-type transport auxiliary lipoprotein family protein [Glycocaulis sp.]